MERMVVKVSSKGQLVIPKEIREALGVRPGTEMHVEVAGRKIVLEPIESFTPVEALYGKYAETDLLSDLETEHREEVQRDETLHP